MRKPRNFGTPNVGHISKICVPWNPRALINTCFFLTRQFSSPSGNFPDGVRRVPVAGIWHKSPEVLSFDPWSHHRLVLSLGCALYCIRKSALPLFVTTENAFRTQMIKGFGGILGILVICKDFCRQFTTGKSPIVIAFGCQSNHGLTTPGLPIIQGR